MISSFRNWFDKNKKSLQEDYFQFLRFKSISADPQFANETKSCAKWLASYIKKYTAFNTELIETKGYPLIYAENCQAGQGAKTLLIYGHYDVQPVDPLELWLSDPFTPTIRNGQIFARGAVDDKGQIFFSIIAARAWKELGNRLPINLKFCIEGEEESSSMGLSASLSKLKTKLKTDALLVADFGQFDEKTPAVSLGARGILTMEVKMTGSKSDLHSGEHGGMAYNPNRALVELLSKLWDENGKIAVPGFYDDVQNPTEKEKKSFAFRYDKERYSKEFGISAFGGQKNLSLAENNLFMPTLEINGMGGGYTGSGFKTVIPKEALAKISVRLVPGQDPNKVGSQVASFLKKQAVKGMEIQVSLFGGEPAFRSKANSKLAESVVIASEEATGAKCKRVLSGASIPIMAKMTDTLKCDIVGMGYCLPTDNIHAPNEHFDWERFEKGFLTIARVIQLYS